MSNYLTNFSNGITHFARTYPAIREATRLSIPFKKNTLGDALASLVVFGNVTITEPASFPALNQAEHSAGQVGALSLDPANVNRDLATKLSGARIEILERGSSASARGTLIGIQPFSETGAEGSVIDRYQMVILDEEGVVRSYPEPRIAGMKFLDEEIQAEIQKALARNFQRIKPDSAFVNIGLAPSEADPTDAPFVIEYTIPTAAWQPVYQLRLKDDHCELEALAKVDNPTDEDWNDYIVSVVTGDPNTFETDLALIRQPKRRRVNIVSDEAIGAVTAAEALSMPQMAAGEARSEYSVDFMAVEQSERRPMAARRAQMQRAQSGRAQTTDVGDFAVYTCEHPVSIGANRSAVIPLFRSQVEGSVLLIYQERSDAERPFRAVRFKNTTANSLGRGSCTVYNEGTYQGQCVLESVKPGEERILPHARENGVRVWKNPVGSEPKPWQSRRSRLEIAQGVVVSETVNTVETVYRVQNNKAERFRLEIEHLCALPNSEVRVRGGAEPFSHLQNGVRIPVDLAPLGDSEVRVSERQAVSHSVTLEGADGALWLLANVVDGPDAPQPAVNSEPLATVLEAYQALQMLQQTIRDGEAESQSLQREQTRKMELVKSAGSGSSVDTWLSELAENEQAIQELERRMLPQLRKEEQQAQRQLNEALRALHVAWTDVENTE